VAENREKLEAGDTIWDTRTISSDQSIQIPYDGPELESKRYHWRVKVWDKYGNSSSWSSPAFWEMGLLNSDDWQAQWIEPGLEQDTTKPQPYATS
jgi:alpha-L-rhamnosidase